MCMRNPVIPLETSPVLRTSSCWRESRYYIYPTYTHIRTHIHASDVGGILSLLLCAAPSAFLTLGYHDRIMRATNATSKYRRMGSSTSFVGPTHAGASAAARSGNPPSAASATTAAPAASPLAVDAGVRRTAASQTGKKQSRLPAKSGQREKKWQERLPVQKYTVKEAIAEYAQVDHHGRASRRGMFVCRSYRLRQRATAGCVMVLQGAG